MNHKFINIINIQLILLKLYFKITIFLKFSSVRLCLSSVKTFLYMENERSTSTDVAGAKFKHNNSDAEYLDTSRFRSSVRPSFLSSTSFNLSVMGWSNSTFYTVYIGHHINSTYFSTSNSLITGIVEHTWFQFQQSWT